MTHTPAYRVGTLTFTAKAAVRKHFEDLLAAEAAKGTGIAQIALESDVGKQLRELMQLSGLGRSSLERCTGFGAEVQGKTVVFYLDDNRRGWKRFKPVPLDKLIRPAEFKTAL